MTDAAVTDAAGTNLDPTDAYLSETSSAEPCMTRGSESDPGTSRGRRALLLTGGCFIWGAFLYLWMASSRLWLIPPWVLGWLQLLALAAPIIVVGRMLWAGVARSPVGRAFHGSSLFVFLWAWAVFTADWLGWDLTRVWLARVGTAVGFVVGLCWTVWGVDGMAWRIARGRQDRQNQERSGQVNADSDPPHQSNSDLLALTSLGELPAKSTFWNPFDVEAWYYGRAKRLNQSLTALVSYSLLFFLVFLILTNLQGCAEVYELPAGGGEQQQVVQQVQIQKVKKKKFVINPFSSIIFNPPPLEEVQLQLEEVTKHLYQPGYGQGEGSGFAGPQGGKVDFVRLEYAGGNWNNRVEADLNMLQQYGVRLSHTVAKLPKTRTISQIGRIASKVPPVVYLNGSKGMTISKREVKFLREYLVDKHGMIFADASSKQFDSVFRSLMTKVLPKIRPVPIPLDDKIHQIPFQVPFVAYVTPHGGKEALGWKIDGRWVVYYHPGDIGDAWMDDHAGVSADVWEACFRIGTNVLFYAYAEHAKWREAQGL